MSQPEHFSQPLTRNKGFAQRLLEFSRKEFNKQRKLFIQRVPPVTHQDVKEYMTGFVPADIVISKRLQHVIITLKSSDDIDKALVTLKNRWLGGHPVQLELYPRRMMLYICGLPLHYTDQDFSNFLSTYGEVETAFLSLTSQGDSKGYGFVEFAHNRATLEKVEQRLNGSSLNGQTLYCGLVSDTIRTFEQTSSTSLFCCRRNGNPPVFSKPSASFISTSSFRMPDGYTLHVLECRDSQTAEQLWYHSHAASGSAREPLLKYAMPAVSAEDLAAVIQNAWRPCVQSSSAHTGLEETRYNIHRLFYHQPQLAHAVESLVSRLPLKLQVHPLSTETIMELVEALQPTGGTHAVPFTSELPPLPAEPNSGSIFYQDSSSNADIQYQGPLTRARLRAVRTATSSHVRVPRPTVAGADRGPTLSTCRNFHDQIELAGNSRLDKPTSRQVVEGLATGIVYNKEKVKSPSQGRKRKNSGRGSAVVECAPQGWSIWGRQEYQPSVGCLTAMDKVEGRKSCRDENVCPGSTTLTSTPDSGPVAKKAFRKTPGAEKRESRLLQTSSDQRKCAKRDGGLVQTTSSKLQLDSGQSFPSVRQHDQGLGICYGNSYMPIVKDKRR